WDREANRYDAHPIVRGVVWKLADREARNAVHAAIDAHFEPIAVPEWEQVQSLADLTPAIERYHTLVERGRLDDALALFRDRLEDATLHRLAAHRERIAMLEQLFPDGTDKLPAIESEACQSGTLNELAMSYHSSGRPGHAATLYERCDKIDKRMNNNAGRQSGLFNLALSKREAAALRHADELIWQVLFLSRELEATSFEGVALQELGRLASTVGGQETAYHALS
ncbi:MAG: hypothetical protein ACR2RE_07890, partial [Geminicoccaceae bacterium]